MVDRHPQRCSELALPTPVTAHLTPLLRLQVSASFDIE